MRVFGVMAEKPAVIIPGIASTIFVVIGQRLQFPAPELLFQLLLYRGHGAL